MQVDHYPFKQVTITINTKEEVQLLIEVIDCAIEDDFPVPSTQKKLKKLSNDLLHCIKEG